MEARPAIHLEVRHLESRHARSAGIANEAIAVASDFFTCEGVIPHVSMDAVSSWQARERRVNVDVIRIGCHHLLKPSQSIANFSWRRLPLKLTLKQTTPLPSLLTLTDYYFVNEPVQHPLQPFNFFCQALFPRIP